MPQVGLILGHYMIIIVIFNVRFIILYSNIRQC